MFINRNIQMTLCQLSAGEQNANTRASEVSSAQGSLVAVMLQNLYTYWNKKLAAESGDTNQAQQNQYSMDSTESQNQENGINAIVNSINTNVSNLSSSMKQLLFILFNDYQFHAGYRKLNSN